MKKYYSWFLIAMISAVALPVAAEGNSAGGRNIDAGVLYDARYSQDNANYLKYIDNHIIRINALGLKAEKVDADIFLAANKAKRDSYKRILVLYYYIFSPEMYSGMEDYVKNGGLFITDSAMVYADMNNNFIYDKSIDKEVKQMESLHGIAATSSVKLENITARIECPLTKGFEKDKPYECSLNMRMTKNVSATVVMTGTAFYKNEQKPMKEMPVLTFKHLGNGAFIYLGIPNNNELFKNCFSDEVLEWLTNIE